MPPLLPPSTLGILLGTKSADIKIDVFIDLCCPFSKKIFKRLYTEVFPLVEATKANSVCFCFYLTPQPWHPQSSMMTESVIAVKLIVPDLTLNYINSLFDAQESFFDAATYSKSRIQVYEDLSIIAAEFVEKTNFMKLLERKVTDDGSLNSGNETTQTLKWYVKYHRSCGVHVTPTVFVNNIEAGHISSGWSLAEWTDLLFS